MAELSTPLGDESGGEREFLTLLITLYRDHPELWQLRSKDYFNKNKKAKVLQTTVDTLKPYKSDFTVEKLKQKINILRTNFNKCYKAIENKKRSGASVDDIPEPNVWYYNKLLFIKDQVEMAETNEHNVLPIVMGARREDYKRFAPDRSYLHVDDYESPEQLAEHLRQLDADDDLYNEYFRWKGTGEFIDTRFFCRLCAMLHDDGAPAKSYKNLDRWWRGPDVCDNLVPEILTQLPPPPLADNDREEEWT